MSGSRKKEEGSRKKEEGVSAIKNVLTVGRGCYINQILIEITPIHLMSWCGLCTLRKLSGADFAPYKNCFSLLSSFGFLTSVTSVTESVAELPSSILLVFQILKNAFIPDILRHRLKKLSHSKDDKQNRPNC